MASAHTKGSTIAEHCEALGTTCIVSRTSNNSSIKSLHWFSATVRFSPQQIAKHIFVHKCSKLVKLVATPQLENLRTFLEASYASPSSRRESSLLSSLPRVAHVLHSSAMRERVAKLVCDSIIPLTAAKTVLRRNLLVVLDQ